MADTFTLQWQQFGTAVAAIGSLGVAAFGITESFGKALTWCTTRKDGSCLCLGLPYRGLGSVMKTLRSSWAFR